MMKNGKKSFFGKTALLFGAAAVLLVASTVGSARAALTYYSENYEMQVSVSYIGVSLEEGYKDKDGKNVVNTVCSRSYDRNNNVAEVKGDDALLKHLQNAEGEGKSILPGKKYDEKLSVTNRGEIDCYVRVIVRKSWIGKDGSKNTGLSPDLIQLDMDKVNEYNGWIKDTSVSGKNDSSDYQEQMVLYYKTPLAHQGSPAPAQVSSSTFNDLISVDPAIAGEFTQTTDGNTTTTTYAYDGCKLSLEVEVDAVQTHNAVDAIKSAWGVDVAMDGNGNITAVR